MLGPSCLHCSPIKDIGLIVVEHKDRLTRFGCRSLDTLLTAQGRAIEVVNQAENGTEDLLADLTAPVYSFCARLTVNGGRSARPRSWYAS
jgi:predicted site-specific integrase-resolvase